MIRATTMMALVALSACWAAVGCGGANDGQSASGGAWSFGGMETGGAGGAAAGAGGASQTGGAAGAADTGGAAGADDTGGAGATGGAGGSASTGGSGGSASTGGAGGGAAGSPPAGAQVGTSTVDNEMFPPTPAYDDTNAIYVSTQGSDSSGDGSQSAPYRTIAHALDQGGDGALVVLRGTPALPSGQNVYDEGQVRIRNSHVTVRSAPGEWAVIQCSIDESAPATCVDFDVDASDGKLQRVEVIGGSYYGVAFETKWDWGGSDRSGASRVLLEDCKIHDTGRDAVKVKPGCDDIVIRRCEIYNSGASYAPGATGKNAEGIDNVNADRMVVQDSYIHDTATNGIYFKGGSTDCVIERNRIERTGSGGVLAGFDTSPEFFDLDVNPGYYEAIHGVVRNNIIRDAQCDGIGMYASKNPLIFNNTIINSASDCHAPIYFGLSFQDWDSSAGRPATVDPVIANNVVIQPVSLDVPVVGIRWSTELGGFGALTGEPDMDYNLYDCGGNACTFNDDRPSSPLDNGLFPAWQQHISAEAHSSAASTGLDANGRATASSATVDAGRTIPQVSLDIDGQPRTGAYDMGADEVSP